MSTDEKRRISIASVRDKISHKLQKGDIVTPEIIVGIMNCPVPFNPEETLRFLAEHDGIVQSTGNPKKPNEYRVVQPVTVHTLPTKIKKHEERGVCKCPHCKGERLCKCPKCSQERFICTTCNGLGYCYSNEEPIINLILL